MEPSLPSKPAMPSEMPPKDSSPQPGQDPIISRMITLGIPVTRSNYLSIVDPTADPENLDAEVEASLPPELQVPDEG